MQNRGMTLGPFIHLSRQNPIPQQASDKSMDPSSSPLVSNGVVFEVAENKTKQKKNPMQAILLQSSTCVNQPHILIFLLTSLINPQ